MRQRELGEDRARQHSRKLANPLAQLVGQAVQTCGAGAEEEADGQHRPLLVDRIKRRTGIGDAEELGHIRIGGQRLAKMPEVFAIQGLGHEPPGDDPVKQPGQQVEKGPGEEKASDGRAH